MNQRTTTWALLFVATALLVTKTPLVSVLFSFLLTGIIPGTNIAIPSWALLIFYPATFMLVCVSCAIFGQTLYLGEAKRPKNTRAISTRKSGNKASTPTHLQSTTPSKRRARIAT